jgi:uncharacterized membrane protein (DUF2068 family)
MGLRDWDPATFTCSLARHHTPAAHVAELRPEDSGLGFELGHGERMARCVRCDAWLLVTPPASEQAAARTLPDLTAVELPRRGKALREAIILRLIAVERAVHAVVFGLFAIALFVVEAHLPAVHAQAQGLLDQLRPALAGSGPSASQAWLTRQLEHLLQLRAGTLRVLLATAIVYCVVEGAEAVGLWRLRRWAEYLTALATAGFLPFEIVELSRFSKVPRVTAG